MGFQKITPSISFNAFLFRIQGAHGLMTPHEPWKNWILMVSKSFGPSSLSGNIAEMILSTSSLIYTLHQIKIWEWWNPLFLPLIYQVGRVFANGPGDLGSIPGRVIPKTLKTVLDTSLINTQQYKIRIKDKVVQSRERSSTLPYTSVL